MQKIDEYNIEFNSRPHEFILRHPASVGISRHDVFYNLAMRPDGVPAVEDAAVSPVLGRKQRDTGPDENLEPWHGGRQKNIVDFGVSKRSAAIEELGDSGKSDTSESIQVLSSDDDNETTDLQVSNAYENQDDETSAKEEEETYDDGLFKSDNKYYAEDQYTNTIVAQAIRRANQFLIHARPLESLNLLMRVLEDFGGAMNELPLVELDQMIAAQQQRLKLFKRAEKFLQRAREEQECTCSPWPI